MKSLSIVLLAWLVMGLQSPTVPPTYARAIVNADKNLVITKADGTAVVLDKLKDAGTEEDQDSFADPTVSNNGRVVGWVEYYDNCCTSYPIPRKLGAYASGQRRTFLAGPYIDRWMLVDGGAKIASRSVQLHGESHTHYQLFDTSTGRELESFDPELNEPTRPQPAWVKALDARQ